MTATLAARASVRAVVSLAVVVATVTALVVPATAGSTEERRLEQTQAELERIRAEIEAAKAEQSEDAEALRQAERQLADIMHIVAEAELAVQRQQQAVEAARDELARLQAAAIRQRRLTSARAVELYKQGTQAPLASVLSADGPQQALERSMFVDAVMRSDRQSLEQLAASQLAVDAQREQLLIEEATLQRVLEEQEAILAQVEELRNERALQLAASSAEVGRLEAQEAHLEAESRELAAISRRASQEAAASRAGGDSTPVAAPVGGWMWPARGPVTSEFGPRWGRMHEGIDIGGGSGAPVVAARAGVVIRAGRMGGYGNLVLIDHGGGIVTAYAHLSAIHVSPGQALSVGQRVGSIGCTGSCTGPHLHFEVRVGGAPRNPRNYLP